jgi:RND family efflux transporter MFP subunit
MKSPVLTARIPARFFPILLLAVLPIAACGGQHGAREPEGAPIAVHTAVAEPGAIGRVVEAVGSLHGAREAILSAKVMGTVLEIRKNAGDPVERGEILVVLDDREVAGNIGQAEGALAQATAAASLAEANLRRYEQLFARSAASQLELDQARFAHETAQGAVRQAEAAVATATSYRSYAQMPAPFDGHVVDRLAEVGDLAAPGRPLMKVEDARQLRLHVSLPESETATAATGTAVEVVVPSMPGTSWPGLVAEVVPAVDPATRTTLVKIDLPADPTLRSGLFARARFAAGERQALRVPRGAVVERGGMRGVYVVEENRASFRLLVLAESAGDGHVEVLSGLAAGDHVVVSPPATLTEGAPVEVQP